MDYLYDCDKKIAHSETRWNLLKHVKTCSKPNDDLSILYKTERFFSLRTHFINNRATVQSDNMDQTEHDLIAQAAQLNMREEFLVCKQRCDYFIELLEKQSWINRPRLSIRVKQSSIARVTRLENLKDTIRWRFVQVGTGYSAGLRRREIDMMVENRYIDQYCNKL